MAATKIGDLNILCKAIEIIIVAIGRAKNNSKTFISFLSFMFYYILCIFFILVNKINYSYFTFTKNNPCGAKVFPAFCLSLEFIISFTSSGLIFPRPTSTKVPAIILTIL